MTLDSELLRHYTEAKSEDAFGELVRRHLDVVYSAALRQVNGDVHLAQDIVQSVFIDLSRKAEALSQRPVLIGWLYTSTHFAAATAVRTEQRRRAHEQEAHAMQESIYVPSADVTWESLSPVLDQVMQELEEPERDVILMRYFQDKSAAEIAQILGISDEAAQKRVSRAVDRLREFFAKRGVAVAATGLVAVISANAVQAATIGLASTISTAAALAGPIALAAATDGKTIATNAFKRVVITVALIGAFWAVTYEARLVSKMRSQIQTLETQGPLTGQLDELRRERDAAIRKLSLLLDENERLNRNTSELLRLRNEITLLRKADQEPTQQDSSPGSTQSGFQVDGSVVYKSFNLDGSLETEHHRSFNLFVAGCTWYIRTWNPAGTDPEVYRDVTCDGERIFTVRAMNSNYFGPVMIQTNGSFKLVPASESPIRPWNNGVAGTRVGVVPNEAEAPLATPLWLAYASSCYFKGLTNGQLLPIFWMPPQFSGTFTNQLQCRWELNKISQLPTSVTYLNRGFTNVVFEVLEMSKLNAIPLPKHARFVRYRLPPKGQTEPTSRLLTSYELLVSQISTNEAPFSTVPSLPDRTTVSDDRLATTNGGVRVPAPNVRSTNGWPTN